MLSWLQDSANRQLLPQWERMQSTTIVTRLIIGLNYVFAIIINMFLRDIHYPILV